MLKEQRKQTERMVLNMKRKFLEDMGLEKEQVDKILDENSQDIGKAKGDSEKIQKDLDAANAEVESLKGQISDRDKQLETLKNSTGDVEGMKQEIAKLQADNKAKDDAHAAEIKQQEHHSRCCLMHSRRECPLIQGHPLQVVLSVQWLLKFQTASKNQ